MNYTTVDSNGATVNGTMTLVNGTYLDATNKNYGSVKLYGFDETTQRSDTYTKWSSTNPTATGPLDVQLDFTSVGTSDTGAKITATTFTTSNSASVKGDKSIRLGGGSVQASIDMLAKSDPSGTPTSGLKQGTYYGYDY